ncbi:MAG: BCCT family transporter [Lachnospiraceae bacterium]|nr:BCCT family transporter [Lachnospiraceae bacterium]
MQKLKKLIKTEVTLSFWIALIAIIMIVVSSLVFSTKIEAFTGNLRDSLSSNLGWFYLLLVLFLVGVCFILMLSPAGKIRLGDPGSRPEYSTVSWIAMLFSAGMGIGLVFYGAAEPLSHYAIQAPEAALYSQEALRDAFKYSFFHYGIHAWAIYAIVGLAIAYFQFRKKESTLLSSTLKPLIGNAVEGKLGKVLDSLTIFATVIGVATSLGSGAIQINGGLNELLNVPQNHAVQLIIIIVATVLFMASAISGLDKGVKTLSNLNMILAGLLMVVAFIIGSNVEMMNTFTESIGLYLGDLLRMSTRTGAGNVNQQEWINSWTMFYWSWWLAWSPFVGVFIARISKGRTIREFVSYVLLIPSVFSFLWFSVFGVLSTDAFALDPSIAEKPFEQLLFAAFDKYPLSGLMSLLAIVLVFSFFITSADSATFVLAMQSEGGSLHPNNKIKVLWGILVSAIAAVLLRAGGLNVLQNVLIIAAFPFAILLLLVSISLMKELNYERKQMGLTIDPKRYPKKGLPFRSYEENDDDDDEE